VVVGGGGGGQGTKNRETSRVLVVVDAHTITWGVTNKRKAQKKDQQRGVSERKEAQESLKVSGWWR